MNGQWEGGKGDKTRVSDRDSYRDNYDKIFRKKSKYLFLDDIRFPKDAWLYDDECSLRDKSGISNDIWDIVRSYEEFVEYVEQNGIPHVVSLDHDLCPNALKQFEEALLCGWIDYVKYLHKTGKHCAEYLVNKCKELKVSVPTFYIHSANHLARPIIRKILTDA